MPSRFPARMLRAAWAAPGMPASFKATSLEPTPGKNQICFLRCARISAAVKTSIKSMSRRRRSQAFSRSSCAAARSLKEVAAAAKAAVGARPTLDCKEPRTELRPQILQHRALRGRLLGLFDWAFPPAFGCRLGVYGRRPWSAVTPHNSLRDLRLL